jgi:hypothetical protein
VWSALLAAAALTLSAGTSGPGGGDNPAMTAQVSRDAAILALTPSLPPGWHAVCSGWNGDQCVAETTCAPKVWCPPPAPRTGRRRQAGT